MGLHSRSHCSTSEFDLVFSQSSSSSPCLSQQTSTRRSALGAVAAFALISQVTLKRSDMDLTRLFIGDTAPREERLTPGMSRGARKLLGQNLNAGDGLNSAPSVNLGLSPGPASSTTSDQQQGMDVKTGQVVTCTTPPTALIIVAGMACMTFLVTIALLLLFFSFVKQRRRERQRRAEPQDQQRSSQLGGLDSTFCNNRSVPPESSEYDSAVLVQLPGEVKPNFFAVPMPLLEISSATDSETVGENELGEDDDDGDKKKETLEERAEQQETESIDETPGVIARGDGSYDNPLFTPG